MPVAPKSPPSSAATPSSAKRAGAPKAKGAVRAKSGCYTCRIRRKKCDEQPNEQGFCSTCVRLRLECLGFGAKRPDWLRENRNVLQLRDKIKNFLASQGMIKGHSGAGARSADQPPVLRLTITEAETPPYHSGSSSSPPPTRSQTLSDEYAARSRHPTSHTRGSGWNGMDQTYHPNGHYATNSEYHRSTSPQSMDGYSHPLSSSSPHSLVQPLQRTIRYQPYPTYQQRQQLMVQGPGWSPAKFSTFGPSYNLGEAEYERLMDAVNFNLPSQPYPDDILSNGTFTPPFDARGIPMFTSHPTSYHDVDFLLRCYVTEVVNKQYLLCTHPSRSLITRTLSDGSSTISDGSSHEQQAATLLSRVHSLRFGRPSTELVLEYPDVSIELHGIERALASRSSLTSEDAMAALHLVSAILFDGGHGRWSQYLLTAANYVRSRMSGLNWNSNGLEEIRRLKDKDAFIVKTAIWFDVLASVTTNNTPLLINIVRLLFRPDRSRVQELNSERTLESPIENPETYAFPEHMMSEKEKISMLSPMGCDNSVVWALAEISALATWKREQSENGRLSIEDLVSRGQKIRDELESQSRGPIMILEEFQDDVAYSRYLTAHIFRASAKLYLHTVVSGGYPHVAQIKSAVEEVMRWIRRIPKKPTCEVDIRIHKSVIRSTVFAFYITGALTDRAEHRKLLREYLLGEAGQMVGNIKITDQLLVDIWAERGEKDRAKREVLWRERLLNNQDPILLV